MTTQARWSTRAGRIGIARDERGVSGFFAETGS
jgi:hypothetical protein